MFIPTASEIPTMTSCLRPLITIPVDTTETELPFIDIRNIELKDISLHYNDLSIKLNTVISNLSAKINGTVSRDSMSGNVRVSTSMISLEYGKDKEKLITDNK